MGRTSDLITVPYQVQKTGDTYICSCHVFDICTEASTETEATEKLIIALNSFLKSCMTLGTLERVLEESGMKVKARMTSSGLTPGSSSLN